MHAQQKATKTKPGSICRTSSDVQHLYFHYLGSKMDGYLDVGQLLIKVGKSWKLTQIT